MPGLRRVKELVASLLKRYPRLRRRKRLQLTYVAVRILEEQGGKLTLPSIVEEARRIIRETSEAIDWGITANEYTEEVAAPLVHELAEMGVIEPSPELLREIARRMKKQAKPDNVSLVTGMTLLTRPM